MKACRKNKMRIAWMASGVLDTAEGKVLAEHFKNCPGCRLYWQRMSGLTERLHNAGDPPPAEATESFHRKVVRQILAQESRFSFSAWATALQRCGWKRGLAGVGVSVAVGFAAVLLLQHVRRDEDQASLRPSPAVVRPGVAGAAPPDALASYRRVADISLESLDDLLTRQAAQTFSPSESFTVSSLVKRPLEN